MRTEIEASERMVAFVAQQLERNPAVNQQDVAARVLERFRYRLADVVYPRATVTKAERASTGKA